MVSPGIRFNDCYFSEPARLTGWKAPKYAGLFVILANDGNWAPKPYLALYFGEFGNNTPEGTLPGGHNFQSGEGPTALYISVLPMPFSTTAQRRALRNELVLAYNTPWQQNEVRAVSGLASQLGDTGNGSNPQAAQILMLLANKLLEPQPEPGPRRRIGFIP